MRIVFVTRRVTWSALLIAVLLLLPEVSAGARPNGPGLIRGIVEDGSSGTPVGGIEVDLVSALPGGKERFTITTTTSARGRYVFRRLPTGSERAYALSVVHNGGLFAGKPIDELGTSENRTVVDTRLRIWDTISNPEAMLVQRHNIFVGPSEGGLGVIESLTIVNTSDSAYIGRARSFGREVAQSTFAFALPGEAGDGRMLSESDFFGTPITGTDSGFGLRVAIPPGEWRVMFAYTLEGTAGVYNLSRTALYPTLNTALHVTDALSVDSNRLSDAGEITVGDSRYVRWASDDVVEAGEPIQISVTAEAGTSPWLVGGLVGAGILAAGLFAWTFTRNRRPAEAAASSPRAPTARDRLVAAVAQLDLRHDAGDLDDDEWRARRAELKSELVRATTVPGEGGAVERSAPATPDEMDSSGGDTGPAPPSDGQRPATPRHPGETTRTR